MKGKITIFIFIAIFLCGCAKETSFNFPQNLDVPDKGKYTVFYIDDNKDISDDMLPEFLRIEGSHNMQTLYPSNIEEFNQLYDNIQITDSPYYIFLGSEEKIFKTGDINKAAEFFSENILK
ncbi:hypothetical protein FZC79_13520 [Rossellomorea vietnamensis]|uniref:Lipoprotein n=1 Tax=Rossellomorea vietnamensis TaxID=218284 RepID=A0A5D4KE67_9BACI|nr:hypothetical protein [Rossellomorea vietnamensis]TYR74493.1 hypothetical protein FZC79_13520 [Rossellomorea vietnamensis]